MDNCTLVMSQEEFMWQSYYMAQVLASTVVGSGVLKVLSTFEVGGWLAGWVDAWLSPHAC